MLLAGTLFAGVLYAPWWVPAGIGFLMMLRFRAWEVIGSALILDMLYGIPETVFGFVFTTAAVALIVILEPLRQRLISG